MNNREQRGHAHWNFYGGAAILILSRLLTKVWVGFLVVFVYQSWTIPQRLGPSPHKLLTIRVPAGLQAVESLDSSMTW